MERCHPGGRARARARSLRPARELYLQLRPVHGLAGSQTADRAAVRAILQHRGHRLPEPDRHPEAPHRGLHGPAAGRLSAYLGAAPAVHHHARRPAAAARQVSHYLGGRVVSDPAQQTRPCRLSRRIHR